MNKLDQDIQDAKMLKSKIQSALKSFRYPPDNCESEVKFRYETLYNMLIIFENDTTAMVVCWETERREKWLREAGLRPTGDGVSAVRIEND